MTTPLSTSFMPYVQLPLSVGPVLAVGDQLQIAGKQVAFFGANIDATAIWSVLNRNSSGQMAIDPAQEAVIGAELDNFKQVFDSARIHGLDASRIGSIFKPGSGTQMDPVLLQALDWFLWQLELRGIRFILELHYARQIYPSDLPPSPGGLALECVSQAYPGEPVGTMFPWVAFDEVTLQPMQKQFNHDLLRHVNQYAGVAIGDSPALWAVELTNEANLAKMDVWGEPSYTPVLQQAFVDDATAFMAAQGKTLSHFGAVEHEQCWAARQTKWLGSIATDVRILTKALVITDSYFGNAPYSALATSLTVGDVVDFHIYSRGPATDSNGFSSGRTGHPEDLCARYDAVAAGCSWGKPVINTEVGPQAQHSPFPLDPFPELLRDAMNVTASAVAKNVSAIYWYSWFHAPIMAPGSQYQPWGTYDLRFFPDFADSLQGCAKAFRDLGLRSATVVLVKPTGGMYGSMVTDATGHISYQNYGPFSDPQLFQVPPGAKVLMAP
jgi:hypothetical protein